MLKGLVERFGRRGATDHLRSGWRRVQEELDLRELFVLTSSHARDVPVDDDAALIDVLSEEQRGLTYDEVKAEVTKNLTANLHTMCGEVRDALRATNGVGHGSRDDVTAEYRRRAGFSAHVAESTAPNAGRGLFVNGQVDPGEIVCVYPGVVYAAENLRHMPGYPKIATDNPYLVARYDGSVVDALPWGLGAGWSAKTRKNGDGWTDGERRRGVEGFGRWPGAPIGTDARGEEGGQRGGRGGDGVGWLRAAAGETPLDPTQLEDARAAADAVDRRHPLALAHLANHPPKGASPNVAVASVDVVFDANEELDGAKELRRYLPNVGLGRWRVPLGTEEAKRRGGAGSAKRRGGFVGSLARMFGEDDEDGEEAEEAGSPPGKVVVPTLVLVAKRFILNEEVFLNYRLSTHVKRPDWYHPVNAEEEKRRWAVGG
jgi:hypothetical protein